MQTLPPLASLIAEFDWSKTSIGPIASWSPRLKAIVDLMLYSPVAMTLLWGDDGVMIYNDAYALFANDRHPEILGTPVRQSWPEVADWNDTVMKRGLAGESWHVSNQPLVLHRNGASQNAWMNLSYSPVHDETGKPVGVLAIVVETTDTMVAKQKYDVAETSRRESEEFTQLLLDSAGEAFYAVDTEGNTTACNNAFLEVMGFSNKEEVLGRKLHGVIHHLHPDGTVYHKEDCPIYNVAGKGGSAHVDHEFFYRPDGTAVPVDYRVHEILRDGKLAGAICTFMDITERRKK